MKGQLITGIDVGSANVRIAICERSGDEMSGIRALVKVPSAGLKNGYIVNEEAARESVGGALREAERFTGGRLKRALLSIGGVGLGTATDISTVAISRADSIVSEFDISRLIEESESRVTERPNIKVIHTIPAEFKIDGRKIMGKPHGFTGNKLELKTTFITCAAAHHDALVSLIEKNGVEVADVYAGPIAESVVTTGTRSRSAGALIANIGAQSVSILTCEDNLPTTLKVFPLGSTDITHDIALGLKVPIETAEEIKLSGNLDRKLQKQVAEIVEARLSDILELIETHLKKIGRSGLLPAGVIFTGEGSRAPGLENLARHVLNLPAKVARNEIKINEVESARAKDRLEKARGPEWSTALGLCVLGMSQKPEESLGIRVVNRTKVGFVNFLRQFLP